VIQDPGDAGNPKSNPLTPLHQKSDPGSEPFVIDLLQVLLIDSDLESRKWLESGLKMRGHEVASSDSPKVDTLSADVPVDVLIVRIDQQIEEAIPFVRSVRRLFHERGIVVLGVATEPLSDSQTLQWLETGIDDFLFIEQPKAFEQRIQIAEHQVRRNRSRHQTTRDVTTALRRFEILFANGGDAQLIVTPRDGRILDASVRCKSVLGRRREEISGHFLSLLFPDLFRRDDLLGAGESARTNRAAQTVQNLPYRRPDGSRCVLEARVSAVPWGESEVLAISIFDVTVDRARQERRIRSAKLDTVSSFAGGIADDLSNLFTAVKGNLSLIGKQPTLGIESRELLRDAESACTSADKVVAQLRLLSKSNAEASSARGALVRRRPLHLSGFLERVVSFELLGSNVRPTFNFDSDIHPIEADEPQLELAVREIVNNALDAMPSGGALRVLASNYEAPASKNGNPTDYVLVSIVDDGPGISPEHLSHVFDPYFSTRADRAGLGLATSQALVRSHGGIIDIEPASVRGTVVRIYLPAATSTRNGVSIDEISQSPGGSVHPDSGRRHRVLVMDDDKDIRIITKKILVGHGFDVYCTKDGREAIEVYQKAHIMGAPFDVALFDLDVRGGMGGKDAVARLRRDFPSIRVILMTGYVDDVLLENHREHGFSGVITKPFQIDKLIATISQFADARRKE
jgi:PAS domain S-box-containing protein